MAFNFSESEQKTRDLTPQEFVGQRGNVVEEATRRLGGQFTSPSQFVAGLTPVESAGFEAFARNAFGPGGSGVAVDDFLTANLGQQNPFLAATIDAAVRPIIQNAELQELRERSAFTGAGQKLQGSTAFAQTRADAVRDTEQAVADTSARIAAADRQNQAVFAQLASERLNQQIEQVNALALPRLIEQYGIDRANTEIARRQQIMDNALALLAGLTSPTLGTFGTSQAVGVDSGARFGGSA